MVTSPDTNVVYRIVALVCIGLLLTLPRPVHGVPATYTATQAANGLLGMGRLRLAPDVVWARTSTTAETTLEPYLGFGRSDADLLSEILTRRVPELVQGIEGSARIIGSLSAELDLARQARNSLQAELDLRKAELVVERTTTAKLTEALQETQDAATISTGVSLGILVTAVAAFAVGFLVAK